MVGILPDTDKDMNGQKTSCVMRQVPEWLDVLRYCQQIVNMLQQVIFPCTVLR